MLSLLNQCNDFNLLLPVLDRILLISWLLKDFGWMTTNVYLGWPFGFISIVLHIVILFVDPRPAFRFYNISLLLWVCGNFIWMSIEYIHVNPSSNVHFGPKTPIGVMDSETVSALVDFKGFLFLASTSIQIIMYVGIYLGKIPMAEDDNEDIVARNEIALLIGEKHLSLQQVDGLIQTNNNDNDTPRRGISIAFIDYLYVIFWISKDLFWSWGTGDFYTKGKATAVSFESLAILFGFLSLFAYILCAYIRRRQLRGFVDALTTLFWISANFIWMSGEFFLRYQNEELDDADEGSDQSTRIASSCFFCLGLSLQLVLIGYITWKAMDYPYVEMCFKSNIRNSSSSSSNARRKASARIQMFSITDENNILPVYSPQHKMISDADDIAEDEVIVMF